MGIVFTVLSINASLEEFLLAFERGRITADTLQKNIKEYISQHNLDIHPDILLKLLTQNPLTRPAPGETPDWVAEHF